MNVVEVLETALVAHGPSMVAGLSFLTFYNEYVPSAGEGIVSRRSNVIDFHARAVALFPHKIGR